MSTIEKPDDSVPSNGIPAHEEIAKLNINECDVLKLLAKLPSNKATGPDNIGNLLLKKCANGVSPVITKIFNLSLSLGVFPKKWKIANIVPIHKKASIHDCKNYRPISLLPCISKVFEKLVFAHVYLHLRRNNVISEFQSGFTPGDSTIYQLTHITDKIFKAVDEFEEVLACFLDLTRAFDTVWRKGLLYKLDKIGIRDNNEIGNKLFSWFKSYLSDRAHRVSVDGVLSDIAYTNAGVPQGSVLGPLLFLIYINDICLDVQSNIFLFADDTSIFRSGKNIEELASGINSDLNLISLWAKKWKIQINPDKTVGMLFSRKSEPSSNFIIKLANDIIKISQHHKHLGLWLSSNLTWTKHISELALKARKRLGCLKRHKYRLSRKVLERCYLTFIRPVMEYGNILYDSASDTDLKLLEDIEKDALRLITGARRLTNLEGLYNEVSWPSLMDRRKIQKLVTLSKIMIKRNPAYLVKDLPKFYDNVRNVYMNTFQPCLCKHEYYKKSFIPSVVKEWNSLPGYIRGIRSVDAIRSEMNKNFIKSVPSYYYYGPRKLSILHTQLRLRCSNLNSDKFRIGICDTSKCARCDDDETPNHYLLECFDNLIHRIKMLDYVTNVLLSNNLPDVINVEMLLTGIPSISNTDNEKIFQAVQNFIEDSKRFK